MQPTMKLLILVAHVAICADNIAAAFDHAARKLDVVLCLDNSQSAPGPLGRVKSLVSWTQMLTFSQGLIPQLNVQPGGSHVGVVDFGDIAHLDLKNGSVYVDVLKVIGKIPYRGEKCNMFRGLELAHQLLTDPKYGARDNSVSKVIIVITRGDPNVETEGLSEISVLIKNAGIHLIIVSVGVVSEAKKTLFHSMSSSENDYVSSSSFSNVLNLIDIIIHIIFHPHHPHSTAPTTTPLPTTTETTPTTTETTPTTTPTTTEETTTKFECKRQVGSSVSPPC